MADMTKKAAGYVQVKLVPADRSGQTWSGWAQRWVDLLVVSEDSGQSKLEKTPEAWLEVRKSKNSSKPIKVWTINATNTILYRCTSKKMAQAFAIQYKEKDILYMSGDSETESHGWMKIIRESLSPTDKIVEIEISAGRLFEASVIDNRYSASCGLFGKYGHLSCRENKLIMFDHNGANVIQEWYLHTIRKFQACKAKEKDEGRLLSIHLGENSSTGCGVVYFYCYDTIPLIQSVQTSIREVFDNIGDDYKNQQATLMSLGALHDVNLEEPDGETAMMTLIIADEIVKAKQELSQSGKLQTMKLTVPEATNKDEPFVWKDNELYEEPKDEDTIVADYTPPDEEIPRRSRRAPLSQSLNFIRRPRANSLTPKSEPILSKLQARRGSLPQSGRFQSKFQSEEIENDTALQLLRFQHMLNLADQGDSEKIFPVVKSPKIFTSSVSRETELQKSPLDALDECSEESASLHSFSTIEKSLLDEGSTNKPLDSPNRELNSQLVESQPKDGKDGDETLENVKTSSEEDSEPVLDLRLREPEEITESIAENESNHLDETPGSEIKEGEGPTDVIDAAHRQATPATQTEEPAASSTTDEPATVAITEEDRRGSVHTVKIQFGAPPKPKRNICKN